MRPDTRTSDPRAIAALLLATLGLAPAPLTARPFRPGLMPNGWTVSCGSCHLDPDGGGPRNAFGAAVESRVTRNGREPFWDATLAALDSDGDGFSNGAELQDPTGAWTPGDPPPGDPSLVTNPGVADRIPPPPDPGERAPFVRGDTDDDGTLGIPDAVRILEFLFRGGGNVGCADAADVDASGTINLSDAVHTLRFLFAGGSAPPAPFPGCGAASGESSLGCELATHCQATPPVLPPSGRVVRIEGPVLSIGADTVAVLGLTVRVPPGVRIEDDSEEGLDPYGFGEIRIGHHLEVRALDVAGGLVATRIEREDARERISLLGPPTVDEMGALSIVGVPIDETATPRYESIDRAPISREELLALAAANPSWLLRARGAFAGGRIVATEISLEIEDD